MNALVRSLFPDAVLSFFSGQSDQPGGLCRVILLAQCGWGTLCDWRCYVVCFTLNEIKVHKWVFLSHPSEYSLIKREKYVSLMRTQYISQSLIYGDVFFFVAFNQNAGTDKSMFPLPEPQDVFLAAQVKFDDLSGDLRQLGRDLTGTWIFICSSYTSQKHPMRNPFTILDGGTLACLQAAGLRSSASVLTGCLE